MRRRRRAALIKSNNPHLAGGEKQTKSRAENNLEKSLIDRTLVFLKPVRGPIWLMRGNRSGERLPSESKIEEPTPKKTKLSGIHSIRNH